MKDKDSFDMNNERDRNRNIIGLNTKRSLAFELKNERKTIPYKNHWNMSSANCMTQR